jgi:DNA-binding transcriptional ArsR family regulator
MGKNFHNRGPFENFYFMPAIFMPIRGCRWFEQHQILIFDAVSLGQQDNRMIADALKMLSDKTRYQILVLLKAKKSMNGIEIAEQMKLATSTVSHHMTHLKNSGLIHEEPVGNTKYYSINRHSMKNCIETLEKTFL